MHGPGFSYYSPGFPDEIPVLDGVVRTLRRRRRQVWLDGLAHAIELWSPAVTMHVYETEPRTFVGLGEPDWPASTSETASFNRLHFITLVRSTYTPDLPKWWPFAWSYAYASFYNVPRLLRQPDAPTNKLDRVICHEIGHNLGLAHGGNGIMSGGLVPNAHDIGSVRNFYFP